MGENEAALQRRCMDAITRRGGWVMKAHQGGYGRRGIPDVIACYLGIFLAIECKGRLGKPSHAQLQELHKIRDGQHGIAILAYPGFDVDGLLEDIKRRQQRTFSTNAIVSLANDDHPLPKLEITQL
jgi:hypothetical protein